MSFKASDSVNDSTASSSKPIDGFDAYRNTRIAVEQVKIANPSSLPELEISDGNRTLIAQSAVVTSPLSSVTRLTGANNIVPLTRGAAAVTAVESAAAATAVPTAAKAALQVLGKIAVPVALGLAAYKLVVEPTVRGNELADENYASELKYKADNEISERLFKRGIYFNQLTGEIRKLKPATAEQTIHNPEPKPAHVAPVKHTTTSKNIETKVPDLPILSIDPKSLLDPTQRKEREAFEAHWKASDVAAERRWQKMQEEFARNRKESRDLEEKNRRNDPFEKSRTPTGDPINKNHQIEIPKSAPLFSKPEDKDDDGKSIKLPGSPKTTDPFFGKPLPFQVDVLKQKNPHESTKFEASSIAQQNFDHNKAQPTAQHNESPPERRKEAVTQPPESPKSQNHDFRTRIQEDLLQDGSPSQRKFAELAESGKPQQWLETHKNSDEHKYLQYRHHLEKVGLILKSIESSVPELSVNTPAARRLAQAIERSGDDKDISELTKYLPPGLDLQGRKPSLVLKEIKETAKSDPQFELTGMVAQNLANRILHSDIPSLRFQTEGITDRAFGSKYSKEVTFQIDKNQRDVLAGLVLSANKSEVPVSELAKNLKIADYGFRDVVGNPVFGKISLAMHDLIDHVFVLRTLEEKGLLNDQGKNGRGYGKLLRQLGDSIQRDSFGRESELIASAAYNTRSFGLVSSSFNEAPIKLRNLIETLTHSKSINQSANQREALRYFQDLLRKDPMEKSKESQLLQHVYSSVAEELQEQTRKTDRSLLRLDNGQHQRIQVVNPEYIALILDVTKIASSPEAKTLVNNLNLELEAYLRTSAEHQLKTPFSASLDKLSEGKISNEARQLSAKTLAWFRKYPDFLSRRAPIGR